MQKTDWINVTGFIWLLICTYMDIKWKRIHIVALGGFGLSATMCQIIIRQIDVKDIVLGAVLGFVFILLGVISREKIGFGDGMLILDIGILLGFWKTLSIVWIACLLAGITGMILMFLAKKSKNYRFAFVPYILCAFILTDSIDRFGGFA